MSQDVFYATNPATGEQLDQPFPEATDADVDRAAYRATEAFRAAAYDPPRRPAELLDAIAERIMALGDALLERAEFETALPRPRLIAERARTVGQIKMFADIVREGSWVEAVIDTGDRDRKPQPKPDLRRMLRPRGKAVSASPRSSSASPSAMTRSAMASSRSAGQRGGRSSV